jgi:hypothetical protein
MMTKMWSKSKRESDLRGTLPLGFCFAERMSSFSPKPSELTPSTIQTSPLRLLLRPSPMAPRACKTPRREVEFGTDETTLLACTLTPTLHYSPIPPYLVVVVSVVGTLEVDLVGCEVRRRVSSAPKELRSTTPV